MLNKNREAVLKIVFSIISMSGIILAVICFTLMYILNESIRNSLANYSIFFIFLQSTLGILAVVILMAVVLVVRNYSEELGSNVICRYTPGVCLLALAIFAFSYSSSIKQFVYSKRNTVELYKFLCDPPPYYSFFIITGNPDTLVRSQNNGYYFTELNSEIPFWARKTITQSNSPLQEKYLR